MINNFIAYYGATYIRSLTIYHFLITSLTLGYQWSKPDEFTTKGVTNEYPTEAGWSETHCFLYNRWGRLLITILPYVPVLIESHHVYIAEFVWLSAPSGYPAWHWHRPFTLGFNLPREKHRETRNYCLYSVNCNHKLTTINCYSLNSVHFRYLYSTLSITNQAHRWENRHGRLMVYRAHPNL